VKCYRSKNYVTASYDGRSTRTPSLYVSALPAKLLAVHLTSVVSPPKCVMCEQPHATRECKNPIGPPTKCVSCGGAHPAKFYRLSFISTTQLLTSTATAPPEADNTCFSVQASSLSSSQAADVSTPDRIKHGLKLHLNLQPQRILILSGQCLKP